MNGAQLINAIAGAAELAGVLLIAKELHDTRRSVLPNAPRGLAGLRASLKRQSSASARDSRNHSVANCQ